MKWVHMGKEGGNTEPKNGSQITKFRGRNLGGEGDKFPVRGILKNIRNGVVYYTRSQHTRPHESRK